MHALLCTSGSTGDLLPMLGLARELKARGMTPILGVSGSYRQAVEREGFEHFELFSDELHRRYLEERTNAGGFGRAKVGLRRVVDDLEPGFRFVEEYANRHNGNVCIVAAGWMLGTRVAQEVFDLPMVTLHLQPLAVRSVQQFPFGTRWLIRAIAHVADAWIDSQVAGPLNDLRRRHGLPPVRQVMRNWWLSPDLIVGMFPDWFCAPQPDWPPHMHLAGFQWNDQLDPVSPVDTARLEAFLAGGSPPLVFSRCSAINYGSSYFETCLAAAKDLGRRAVLLTPNAAEVPETLGSDAIHFNYLPLSQILPHACGHLHHGGIGTVAQSFKAGVPQLIVPQLMDQPDNAQRVQRLNAGSTLLPAKLSRSTIARKFDRLLESSAVQTACQDYARRCEGTDGLRDGANLIENMLAARRPSP